MDNEGLNALAGPDSPRKRQVRRALEAASRGGRDVTVPPRVLAESYRGAAHTQAIDSLLARRRPAIVTRDTDRTLARFVGAVLHAAGAGSADIVDAHVVAVAAEAGGGLVLTGHPTDLERLAAPYRSTVIEPLR
ncbi:MAG: VapC toxin family PIN domain ribonuclease [Actinomycetota bacterium]|nr:VapC toxin family PIN domain ribonuclease [Actinomycetota bacterium]